MTDPNTCDELDDFYEHYDFEPDDNYNADDEFDEMELAMQECGIIPSDGGCTLSGTEHCDFECPFRDHPEWILGDDEED